MRPERRPAAGMVGRRKSPRSAPFWRQSVKSREREGSALAFRKAFFLVWFSSGSCSGGLGAPALGPALEHMAVVKQAVEHSANGGHIGQQLAPVFHGTV